MQKSRRSADDSFVAHVKALEKDLFGEEFDPEDTIRMKSDRYSWHYRPSHHVASGLIKEEDIAAFAKPGKRLLSIGAHPAYLERLLLKLGILPGNIVIADNDHAFDDRTGPLEKVTLDLIKPWPEIGSFDLILFPESLCIALSDELARTGPHGEGAHATDPAEAKLLAAVLKQALERLRPGGEIRANGPQSHPNVVKAAQELLQAEGLKPDLAYQRYFLKVVPQSPK